MPRYAESTEVSVDRSQSELRKLLTRYGATNYVMGTVNGQMAIMFEAHARRIRLSMPAASLSESDRSASTNQFGKRERSQSELAKILDQRDRQQWRILLLIIKAKLELIETGAVTFEDEFLPYTMLPDGSTVGEWIEPQMEQVAKANRMPPMLPGVSSESKVIELPERSG